VKKDAVARLIGVLATAPAGPTSGGGKARVLCSSNLHAAGLRGWCYSRKATDGGCAAARARPPGIAGSCAVTRATGGVDQAPETPRKPIGSRSARSVGEVTSTAGTSFPEGGKGGAAAHLRFWGSDGDFGDRARRAPRGEEARRHGDVASAVPAGSARSQGRRATCLRRFSSSFSS
jgi:hypothetical protein